MLSAGSVRPHTTPSKCQADPVSESPTIAAIARRQLGMLNALYIDPCDHRVNRQHLSPACGQSDLVECSVTCHPSVAAVRLKHMTA